jgi:hypothetical protein
MNNLIVSKSQMPFWRVSVVSVCYEIYAFLVQIPTFYSGVIYFVTVLWSISVYSLLFLHLKLDCPKFVCTLFVGTEFLL